MKRLAIFAYTLLFIIALLGCSKAYDPTVETQTTRPSEAVSVSRLSKVTENQEEESVAEFSEPTEPENLAEDDPILAYMEQMTLRDKICQMIMVAPEQLGAASTKSDERSAAALQELPVGGLIFFSNNLVNSSQTCQMLSGLQSQSSIPLFMALDEEGGRVSRAGKNSKMDVTYFPAMGSVKTEEAAYNVGKTLALELSALGFNLDFAPVADVNSNPKNPVIGDRSFSSDPVEAAILVSSCVSGFRENGLMCTLKHFPGHGDTSKDTHVGSAASSKTLEELRHCEFLPFAAGIEAGVPFVMIAHISLPNVLQEEVPASLSYTVCTELLREELGFEGIIITDSLSMGAITSSYSSSEAAVMAVNAGVDILLMPKEPQQALDGLLNAVESGVISESRIDESVYRILAQKAASGIFLPDQPA